MVGEGILYLREYQRNHRLAMQQAVESSQTTRQSLNWWSGINLALLSGVAVIGGSLGELSLRVLWIGASLCLIVCIVGHVLLHAHENHIGHHVLVHTIQIDKKARELQQSNILDPAAVIELLAKSNKCKHMKRARLLGKAGNIAFWTAALGIVTLALALLDGPI